MPCYKKSRYKALKYQIKMNKYDLFKLQLPGNMISKVLQRQFLN